MDIKVSIIIPVYNAEKYLAKTIESVLEQSFENFELITINDGSKDCSLDILRTYAKKDKRIQVVDQKNEGVSKTRNKGISLSKGKYIVFIDSDDLISIDFIESLYNISDKHNADIAITGYNIFYDKKTKKVSKYLENLEKENLVENYNHGLFEYLLDIGLGVNVWNKMFDTSFLRKYKLFFSEKSTFDEDMFFVWKCVLVSKKVYIDNYCRYHYRLTTSSAIMRYHENIYEAYVNEFNDMKEFVLLNGINSKTIEDTIALIFSNKLSVLIYMIVRSPKSIGEKKTLIKYYLKNKYISKGVEKQLYKKNAPLIYKLANFKKIRLLLLWGYSINLKQKIARNIKKIIY